MNWELHLIANYISISKLLQTSTPFKRSVNKNPKFTDAEVLTIYCFGIQNGFEKVKYIHRSANVQLCNWFPELCSYSQFSKRTNALCDNKIELCNECFSASYGDNIQIVLIDTCLF